MDKPKRKVNKQALAQISDCNHPSEFLKFEDYGKIHVGIHNTLAVGFITTCDRCGKQIDKQEYNRDRSIWESQDTYKYPPSNAPVLRDDK